MATLHLFFKFWVVLPFLFLPVSDSVAYTALRVPYNSTLDLVIHFYKGFRYYFSCSFYLTDYDSHHEF